MPKGEQMAQLSRPFQFALGAVLLFAVVWFVALNGHGSSSGSTPAASTPAPTPASTPSAKPAPGSTHIEGMTRAVAHAREAVAASQRASDKSANSSAEAPSQGASVTSSSTKVVTKHGAAGASTTVVTKHGAAGASTTVVTKRTATASGASATVTTKHTVTPAPPHKVASAGIPPRQAAIESELKRGEVAVVLFWNPKGADDNIVHEELQILLAAHHEVAVHPNKAQVRKLRLATGLELEKKIAVHYASASQVASFGTFTKTVQVYGTPTILVINKHGAVTTINGLTDAFAIEQTIDEARQES
jgi:hypothetical protein